MPLDGKLNVSFNVACLFIKLQICNYVLSIWTGSDKPIFATWNLYESFYG